MQSREGECVIVQILAVGGSLQAGDPGLETGHLGLLRGDKNADFDKTLKRNSQMHFHSGTLITLTLLKKTLP